MISLPALLVIIATAVSAGEPVGIEGLQGLGDTRHHIVASESLEHTYHVLVGLPANYAESPDRQYPTVYILDGGELYPLLRAYYNYLRNAEEVPDLILVAISYGTDDWRKGNNRNHDYTAPSDEREFWGGAERFQVFLDRELLPLIENSYRSRSDRRVLFGQSLGGQFVLYTAQTRPGLFWGHVASNPALHRNLGFYLNTRPESPVVPSNLYVASGSDDDPVFREPAVRWIEHWSQVAEVPWRLRTETLDGHSHFSAPPASFRAGLRWLFADAPRTD